MNAPIKIFAGSKSEKLASQIAEAAGLEVGNSSVVNFSDGEFEVAFEETVRGAHVFIVQSTVPPADILM